MIRFWHCPVPLPFTLERRLERVGINNCSDPLRMIPGSCIFIYPAPHQLLGLREASMALQGIIRYSQGSALVIALWRLARLNQESIERWQHDPFLGSVLKNEHPPTPGCLEAVLTLKWLELNPEPLATYLDLEFISQAYGSQLDTHYVDRLQTSIDVNSLHYHWRKLTLPANETQAADQLHEDLDVRRMQLDLAYEEMRSLNEALQQASAEVRRLKADYVWETIQKKTLATLSRSQNLLITRLIRILSQAGAARYTHALTQSRTLANHKRIQ